MSHIRPVLTGLSLSSTFGTLVPNCALHSLALRHHKVSKFRCLTIHILNVLHTLYIKKYFSVTLYNCNVILPCPCGARVTASNTIGVSYSISKKVRMWLTIDITLARSACLIDCGVMWFKGRRIQAEIEGFSHPRFSSAAYPVKRRIERGNPHISHPLPTHFPVRSTSLPGSPGNPVRVVRHSRL